MPRWSWKVADPSANAALNLRYEPGNWGDVLKGEWAVRLARHLAAQKFDASASARPFTIYDPFAGAPDYPLVAASAARLESVAYSEFAKAQEAFACNGTLASTGRLALETARATLTLSKSGGEALLHAFDLDEVRRAHWHSITQACVLDLASAEELLPRLRPPEAHFDLVLWDPYDFFDHWGAALEALVKLAERAPVLIYLYNKAPQGAGHLHQYQLMRKHLAAGVQTASTSLAFLVGRLPSDAILPRAWHEVILVGGKATVAALRGELAEITQRFAAQLSGAGAFEG